MKLQDCCTKESNLKNNVIKHQNIFIFHILKIVFQRKCTGYLISEYCGAKSYLTALHCHTFNLINKRHDSRTLEQTIWL